MCIGVIRTMRRIIVYCTVLCRTIVLDGAVVAVDVAVVVVVVEVTTASVVAILLFGAP